MQKVQGCLEVHRGHSTHGIVVPTWLKDSAGLGQSTFASRYDRDLLIDKLPVRKQRGQVLRRQAGHTGAVYVAEIPSERETSRTRRPTRIGNSPFQLP